MIKRCAILLCVILFSSQCLSEEIRVAVASNFKTTAELIADRFSEKTGHKVTIISGSSSALTTLIANGAPFDVFLSADKSRPLRLIKHGLAVENSLVNYANGQLVFLSNSAKTASISELKLHLKNQTGKLAIANPKLAPYGESSEKFLIKNDLLQNKSLQVVTGNNVIQAMQFVLSKNAESGFVSYSQVLQQELTENYFLLPHKSYPPIKQYGVITQRGSANHVATSFMKYLTHNSNQIISSAGYLLDDNDE